MNWQLFQFIKFHSRLENFRTLEQWQSFIFALKWNSQNFHRAALHCDTSKSLKICKIIMRLNSCSYCQLKMPLMKLTLVRIDDRKWQRGSQEKKTFNSSERFSNKIKFTFWVRNQLESLKNRICHSNVQLIFTRKIPSCLFSILSTHCHHFPRPFEIFTRLLFRFVHIDSLSSLSSFHLTLILLLLYRSSSNREKEKYPTKIKAVMEWVGKN